MGLDIALGVFLLLGAIRGWFKGFLSQGIRFAALFGAIFGAAPLRDLGKPYVVPYLTSVHADILDRLLWWGTAALIYVVSVALTTSIVKLKKKRTLGDPEPNRTDQLVGLWLGGLKAAVVAAFMLNGFEKNGLEQAKKIPWFNDQAKDSKVLEWQAKFHPADKIWTSAPVQQLVAYVHRNGIASPVEEGEAEEKSRPESDGEKTPAKEKAKASTKAVQAEQGRAPRLDLPKIVVDQALDPRTPQFLQELDRQVRELEAKVPR